jgi:hypothetical protein
MAEEHGKGNSVTVGDISGVSGEVNIAGGNITKTTTGTGLTAADIKRIFDQLYTSIDASPKAPPASKEDVKAEVKDIQATVTEAVQKSQPVDESFLARRFRNIARMAPDILDVVVASLGNPLAGLGVAVKKIAEKAKTDAAAAAQGQSGSPSGSV